jgi:glycosyltransferase involved in cell wall biosynthesis
MDERTKPSLNRVAFVGDYLPRQCGIATFTTDLCEAVAQAFPATTFFAVAANDTIDGYAYPPRVRFEFGEGEVHAYRRLSEYLNNNDVDLVCLQHEYGIYGGRSGSHILSLLRRLRMPVVTTLHTVLREPDIQQRRVTDEIALLSDRLVVMSEHARDFLCEIYHVPSEKIDLIPHGVPDVPFVDPNFYKDHLDAEGKIVLLTFGLLSANKGIEYVIDALPKILERYPNVVYMVLGATHPHVKLREGESYRVRLQQLARARGVEKQVIFHNRFVSLEELVKFIGAADIYVTPYLNPSQVVSGTLAYTVGAGKAIVSTPYWYAEELLADERGVLVPFRDSKTISDKILFLLENEAERHAMRKRAYMLGREMIWPVVAQNYFESFEQARLDRSRSPRPVVISRSGELAAVELPALKLDHLKNMTDSAGLLQHSIYSVPNYAEGYSTDDNARALIVTVRLEDFEFSNETAGLAARYLAFLAYAFNAATGRFRNFMSYERTWREETGSEDSHGRALWALGAVIGYSTSAGLRGVAERLFNQALSPVDRFESPRAWAFSLLALDGYLRRYPGDRVAQGTRESLANKLFEAYTKTKSEGWVWFEDTLAYDNATLPLALLLSGTALGASEMIDAGLLTLDWLMSNQRADEGHFLPVGSNGFYPRGGERARFDQQPVEAQATVSACLEASRIGDSDKWLEAAQSAFDWFLGANDLRLPLYDPATGGCRDGLHPDRVNENQGAESTVSFLLALLEMQRLGNLVSPEPT